ncbi:Lmo0850 family protein [Sporosarcina sp.]|nr:Lmo0850 family protein [Sporosarcina sp.]
MAKEMDIKKIISNLAKLGVSATLTKSRSDMLQALTPAVHVPPVQPN